MRLFPTTEYVLRLVVDPDNPAQLVLTLRRRAVRPFVGRTWPLAYPADVVGCGDSPNSHTASAS